MLNELISDIDQQTLLANGQFHEAVLPLPNCRFNSGCRSVMKLASNPKIKEFKLNDEFFISGNVSFDAFNTIIESLFFCFVYN